VSAAFTLLGAMSIGTWAMAYSYLLHRRARRVAE
jgi:hypothetical protein